MNTSIIPNDGVFELKTIPENEARVWSEKPWVSAVGHPGTAAVIGSLLGCDVQSNRIQIKFSVEDEALVFKLDCRLPEGKVLSEEELKDLPYKWKILKRLK
jgi:hypothetical protein